MTPHLHLVREVKPELPQEGGIFPVWCEGCGGPVWVVHLDRAPVDPRVETVEHRGVTAEIRHHQPVKRPARKMLACDASGCSRSFLGPHALAVHKGRAHSAPKAAPRPLVKTPELKRGADASRSMRIHIRDIQACVSTVLMGNLTVEDFARRQGKNPRILVPVVADVIEHLPGGRRSWDAMSFEEQAGAAEAALRGHKASATPAARGSS